MASALLRTVVATVSQPVEGGHARGLIKTSAHHKPFQCGLCSISFSVNRELVVHVQGHFINKPYQCGLCKVSYKSNPDLLSHVQVHNVFLCVPVNTNLNSPISDCSRTVCQAGGGDVIVQCNTSPNCDVEWTGDKRKEGERHEQRPALSSSNHTSPLDSASWLRNAAVETGDCKYDVDDNDKDNSKAHDDADHDGDCGQDSDWLRADSWESASAVCAPVKTERCDSQGVSSTDTSNRNTPETLMHCGTTGDMGNEVRESADSGKLERKEAFVCPVCDHQSDNHSDLKAHLFSTHTVDGCLKCPVCEETFPELCGLKRHYEVCHEGQEMRPYKCNKCDKQFKQLLHLKNHLQCVHGQKVKRLQVSGNCPVCPQQLPSLTELKAHLHSKHTINGRFQCPVCEKSFKAACGLKKHYKLCHAEADRRPHKCHECNKNFKLRHHLRDHRQVMHSAESKAKRSAGDCPLCLLHFESQTEIQTHLQSKHTVDGNFQCPGCEKVFKDLLILKRHHKVYHETLGSCTELDHTASVMSSPHGEQEGSEGVKQGANDEGSRAETNSRNEKSSVDGGHDGHCYPDGWLKTGRCKLTPVEVLLPVKEERSGSEGASSMDLTQSSVHCDNTGGVGKGDSLTEDAVKSERKVTLACPVCDHQSDSRCSLRAHLHSSHTVDGCLKCPVCEKTFPGLHDLKRHFGVHHKQAEARPHRCSQCGKKFKLPHHLKDHLQGVHGQHVKRIKVSGGCPVCPEQFQTQAEVKAHMHNAHTVNGNFQCPACEKGFRELRGLKQHHKVCHAEADVRPHQCEECEWKFKSPHHLKDHLQAVHGHGESQARLGCSLCEKTFKNQRCLKWHLKFCHEEADVRPHQCPQCGNKFKMLHHLKDHMQAIHDQPVQRGRPRGDCPVCPLRFENQTEFKAHVHSVHTVNGRFECPVCKKTLRDVHSLRYHYNLCHVQAEVRPHECQQCGQKFKGSHHLKDHIKTVHEQVKRRSVCHICGKTVSTVSVHMATVHSEARPYKCNFCDLSFKIKTCLNVHLKTHTKEKPFVCETCGKSFARNRTLAFHRNTHTNAKPFTCDVCHAGFNSYPGMRQHRRRHTGDKPYACEICGKKFSSSNNCHRHALTHTDQRPWACDKCGKTYRCRSSLQYHKAHSHMMT